MSLLEIARSTSSLAFSIGILSALGLATWRYVVVPYRTTPIKPIYSNDYGKPSAPKPIAQFSNKFSAPTSLPKPTFAARPATSTLYQARINAGSGLVLRSKPGQDGSRVGGADYNAKVSVIKESPDKSWVYIRQEATKEEGWVRSGNLSRS